MVENKYYLIKQTFPYIKTKINKIYTPCNIIHLKKIISMMDGLIEVFLVSEEDGKIIRNSYLTNKECKLI